MKQRESNLISIISQMYRLSSSPKLNLTALTSAQHEELKNVYKALGGRLEEIPVRFGAWDIVTENFILELDEEQHFNRYRTQTLSSGLYKSWPWFNVESYKIYCQKFEPVCLKKASRGGYWSNPSTENQFGPAAENGTFSGNGSPRWKQRAFYDYCRDLFGLVSQTPVYRLSIYELLSYNGKHILLGQALDQNLQEPIKKFIHAKVQP
jgi:hypothetical protein